jgi:subtilisin family serine protease
MARKTRRTGPAGSTSPPNGDSGPAPPEPPVTASPPAGSDAGRTPFTAAILDKTVIAVPLLEQLTAEKQRRLADPGREPELHPVIIDLNLEFPGGRAEARQVVLDLFNDIIKDLGPSPPREEISDAKSKLSQQYLFAELRGEVIEELVRRDRGSGRVPVEHTASKGEVRQMAPLRAIFHIWPDFEVQPLINRSISTVKADAARNAFAALGEGIVWAVIDSGIDGTHPHFQRHKNLQLGSEADALRHRDFTAPTDAVEKPLEDLFGHGTHVAAIIAGEVTETDGTIEADVRYRDEMGEVRDTQLRIRPSISGMAPKCKLLSLKVLDDQGQDPEKPTPKGRVSNIIAAIDYIQDVNGYGRRIRIHGVNMSVGYAFEPRWFACGQSPLCVEVDRLVKSGVTVVVAAGNTGYASTFVEGKGAVASGMDLTINDPGNADLAITVGSTHRDMPHVYGVSYFSSKGPTGDGRIKPDLVAPGEKIISADSTQRRNARGLNVGPPAGEPVAGTPPAETAAAPALHGKYREDTGTSMAAPHVSGVIAAFLSARGEFIGRAEQLKEIFCAAATDLRRERYFQGRGLVDLMRSIQSV